MTCNDKKMLQHFDNIDKKNDDIGTIKLFRIVTINDFLENSTCYEENELVKYLFSIEEYNGGRIHNNNDNFCLEDMCTKHEILTNNVYYFNENIKEIKPLDFYCQNIEKLKVIKENLNNTYIYAEDDAKINNQKIEKNKIYKLNFATLQRRGNGKE